MEMQKRFFETNSNCRKAKVPLSEFDLYVSTTIQPENVIDDVLKQYSGQPDDVGGVEDDYDYEDGESSWLPYETTKMRIIALRAHYRSMSTNQWYLFRCHPTIMGFMLESKFTRLI